MMLFLFGGAEIGIASVGPAILKKQIKETLLQLHPKSILHIPFARLHPTEVDWKEGWFPEMMHDASIQLLDARNTKDIDNAEGSAIFINGGSGRKDLIDNLQRDKKLIELVMHAQYIVAESAGSMAMGEYLTADQSSAEIVKGLGLLKSTIIEVHYSEKNRQELLRNDLCRTHMRYGVGIDCATALVTDPQEFPNKWKKIGVGKVYVIINPSPLTQTTTT